MDLALRPSPGIPSAPPPSWIVQCLERWGGGYVMNPVHALPVTYHQRSLTHYTRLLHYTNGCTSPKTTFPITHCTDVTQLIALITQLIALITNHTADCTDHTLSIIGIFSGSILGYFVLMACTQQSRCGTPVGQHHQDATLHLTSKPILKKLLWWLLFHPLKW